jgi:N-acetylglucosaminyl-diphospho-decaprenol L-rhamnosyltransferase
MDLAIVVVSWNVRQLLRSCLTSIYQSLYTSSLDGQALSAEVWVVDNRSADGTPEMVQGRFPQVRLIANPENRGFAGGNNQAMEQALRESARFVLLLNPDTAVRDRAMETLVRFMEQTPRAGMAGARLVYGDGSFQHSAFRFPGLAQIALDLFPLPGRLHDTRLNGRYPRAWYEADAHPFRIDHPLGAAMVVRREAVEAVGLMDTGFYMYCEEIDWAMRMWASGWEVYCVPEAEIVHYGGQSTSQIRIQSFTDLWRSRHRLYTKHYSATKVRLAGRLVRAGIALRARQTDSAELRAACREIGQLWTH